MRGGGEDGGACAVPCESGLRRSDRGTAGWGFVSSECLRVLSGDPGGSRGRGGAAAEAAEVDVSGWEAELWIVDWRADAPSGAELFAVSCSGGRYSGLLGGSLRVAGSAETETSWVMLSSLTLTLSPYGEREMVFPSLMTRFSATSFSTIATVFRSAIGQMNDAT